MASHTLSRGPVPTTSPRPATTPTPMKPTALTAVDDDAIEEDGELEDDDELMALLDLSTPTQSSNNVSGDDSVTVGNGVGTTSDTADISADGVANGAATTNGAATANGHAHGVANGAATTNGHASDAATLNSPSKVPLHLPLLVRRTFIHPQCYYDHPDLQVEPVKLKFSDDPAVLTENWTPAEVAALRRIVRFHFTPHEVNVGGGHPMMEYHVGFEAISPNDYDHVLPIVLCIWWQEMNLHIVTSVDIIVLLEHMVRQQFSIEEKNRIRRNLQLLKPYTVARTNHRFLPFFNLIMEMEDPRPRNIEKDIKVFRWADLGLALEKVLFKYTWNVPRFQFYLVRKENQFGQLPAPPPPKHQPDEFVSADRVRRMRRQWSKGGGSGGAHHLHTKPTNAELALAAALASGVGVGAGAALSTPGNSSSYDDDNLGKKLGETTVLNLTLLDEDMTNGVGSLLLLLLLGGYLNSVFSGLLSLADSEATLALDGLVMALRKSPDKSAPAASNGAASADSAQPLQTRYPLHYYQFPAGLQLRYDSKAPVVPLPEVPSSAVVGGGGATVLPVPPLAKGATTLPPIATIHPGIALPPTVLLPPLRDTARVAYPPPPALPSLSSVIPASPKVPGISPPHLHQLPRSR